MIRDFRALLGLPVLLVLCLSVSFGPALAGQAGLAAEVVPCAATSAEKPAPAGKAWLGVTVQELTDELRGVLDIGDEFSGVLVAGVTEGSPAWKAGMRHGDLIVTLGGQEMETPDDVVKFIESKKPGSEVVASVIRNGEKHRMTVVLGKAPARESKDVEIRLPETRSLEKEIAPPLKRIRLQVDRGYLGVNVMDVGPELGDYFGVEKGVLVTEVMAESAGEKAGIRAGDVITAVDGEKVTDREELTGILGKKEEGNKVEVSVLRKGKPVRLEVTLEKGPFWGWMEGVGEKGAKFREDFVMPKVYNLERDVDLERRVDELQKELEKVKEHLKKVDEGLKKR